MVGRPARRLHGDMGDWVCLPRPALEQWGGGTPEDGLMPGMDDYDHLIMAGVPGAPVSLHHHGGVPLIRMTGFKATVFRWGPRALLLNTHAEALNHEAVDVRRLTGTRPGVTARRETLVTASLDNPGPEWVVFDGRFSGGGL